MKHIRMIVSSGPMKKIAKEKLKGHWFEAAAIFLLWIILGEGAYSYIREEFKFTAYTASVDYYWNMSPSQIITLVVVGIAIFLVSGALSVGAMRYVLNLVRDENPKFTDLFYGFTCYWRSFKQYFFYNLIIALPVIVVFSVAIIISVAISQRVDSMLMTFMILFIIILLVWVVYAIVMTFSLFFKFFVIADDRFQYNGAIDSLKTCASMMKGNKAHLFGVAISFIGWYILASIPTFVVAMLVSSLDPAQSLILTTLVTIICTSFVMVYAYTTFAVYYRILRGELKIDIVDDMPEDLI